MGADGARSPACHPGPLAAGLPAPNQSSTMPLKACLHISTFPPGGAQRQIVNLARELAGRGVRVVLLHEQEALEDAYYLEEIRERGVEVISAYSPEFLKRGMGHSRQHAEFFAHIPAPYSRKLTIRFLAGAFSSLGPDIVHSYLDIPNCTGGCAAVLAGVPVHVASFRSLDPATAHYDWEKETYSLYRYLVARGRSHFEANSRAGAEHYARWLHIDPASIAYCPNGIDPAACVAERAGARAEARGMLQIAPDAPVLLSIARFGPEKAPEAMLDVFARALAERPESHYLIAGSQMTGDEMMGAMVRERGLEGHVHLLGARKDVAALFSCADAFLLPSRFEGFPNVLMEAMAAGLPVVASHVGGVPDLVRHGEDGFLHQVGDVEAMAESVVALFADAALRRRLGHAARQRVLEEFSLQKLGDRTVRRYEELLAGAGRPLTA